MKASGTILMDAGMDLATVYTKTELYTRGIGKTGVSMVREGIFYLTDTTKAISITTLGQDMVFTTGSAEIITKASGPTTKRMDLAGSSPSRTTRSTKEASDVISVMEKQSYLNLME